MPKLENSNETFLNNVHSIFSVKIQICTRNSMRHFLYDFQTVCQHLFLPTKRTFSFMCSLLRLCVSLQICIINDASKQLVHEPCSGMMAIITYAAINVVSPLSFYIFQYTTTKPTDHQISDEKLLCSHFCEWPSHGKLDLVYLSLSRGTYLSPKMSFLNL